MKEKIENTNHQKNEVINSPTFWHSKSGKLVKILLQVILLIFLTMSLARVPYVGAFFDATIFSILFGYTKYFAYLLIYILVILSWIPRWKVKLFTTKNILIISAIWLMVSIIISSLGILIDYNVFAGNGLTFKQYFINNLQPNEPGRLGYFDFWLQNDWANVTNVTKSAWFYLNPQSYGGILSFTLVVLFESVAPLVLTILMLGGIIAVIVWQVRKTYYQSSNNDWIKKQHHLYETKKYFEASQYLKKVMTQSHKLPIGNIKDLSDGSTDFLVDLTTSYEQFTAKFNRFLTSLNLDFSLVNKEIMFKSFTCVYKLSGKRSKKIFEEHIDEFNSEFFGLEINYYFDDNNNLVISQKLDLKSIISMQSMLSTIGNKNSYCLGIGQLSDRQNIYINGLLEPNLKVFGSKGSGHSMFVSNLILSIASLNSHEKLSIDIIDTSNKTLKNLNHLSQVNNYSSQHEEAIVTIDQTIELIKTRLNLLQDYQCKDIYSYYNKINKNEVLKTHLLVINGLEDLMVWDENVYSEKLQYILENAFKVGIINVISSGIVNHNTLKFNKYYDNVVVFKLSNENDSWDILDAPDAYYLWGSGDGIILNQHQHHQQHFQTVFVNKEETTYLINTINDNLGSEKGE